MTNINSIRIAVIGLGYVGLPVALELSKVFPKTVGFDINQQRIADLQQGCDVYGETPRNTLLEASLICTDKDDVLADCNFFVITVPTPVDDLHNPDLSALISASRLIGSKMPRHSIVVYESTVYPGVTEDICGPVLSEASGFKQGVDFKLGYSPERINPGDTEHTLSRVIKIVSGEDRETCNLVAEVYEKIVTVGVHRTSSIKVAEAAKVIENTQRDLNIALMNELALIFARMGIRSKEVIDAAATKWNFLPFRPGLVGGHCIGVDPYYLTTKAEQLGYIPQVILAGRRINDEMGVFIGQQIIKQMVNQGFRIKGARVGILGITFKENVADVRNSRVPDIVAELQEFGIFPMVHDPCAPANAALAEYGITMTDLSELNKLDALVLAVTHEEYLNLTGQELSAMVNPNGVFMDVKSVTEPNSLRDDIAYWSL